MSDRLSSNVATAVEAANVNLIMLAKLEFGSGTVYVHNGLGTYTWDGQSWLGVGDLGTISSVEEGVDVSPYALTLTLSGLDAGISNEALGESYYQRPVTIYLGVLDSTDSFISNTPVQIWAGHMDQMNLTVGADGGDAVQLVAESELARFNLSSNMMFTNVSLQQQYSGDLFFSHLHNLDNFSLKWGTYTGGNGPGDKKSGPRTDGGGAGASGGGAETGKPVIETGSPG